MKLHVLPLTSILLMALALGCKEAAKPTPPPAAAASKPAAAASKPAAPTVASVALTPEQVAAFAPLLEDYERMRALLVQDKLEGLAPLSLSINVRAVELVGTFPEAHKVRLQTLGTRAIELEKAAADTMKATRLAFGELSREVVLLLASSESLRKGLHVFECGMADGYQKWVQPAAELDNPYMGQSMPTCGSSSSWD